MRRIIASLLGFCFLMQASGGSAFAQTNTAPPWDGILNLFHPTIAVITPSGTRRAPPPGRTIVTPAPLPPPHARALAQRPIVRSGVTIAGPHMLSAPLGVNEHHEDPRAMFHNVAAPVHCIGSRVHPYAPSASEMLRHSSPRLENSVFIQARTKAGASPARTAYSGMRTMTATPTVQTFQYEADTSSVSTTLYYTTGETGAIAESMDSAPPHTKTSETLTYSASDSGANFGWVSPPNVPNSTSWPAQTYTVTLNVASPNANLKVTEVKLYRVDANADGGTNHQGLAVVGDLTGLSQSLGTAGTLMFQVSGSAQTASATDRIAAKIYVTNSAAASESFSYYAGQNSGSGINVVQPLALVADTGAAPTGMFYTAGETGAVSQIMDSASSSSSIGETLTYTGNDAGASWGWVSAPNAPNLTSWPAGNYAVTLNVTQANANLKITEVKVYRVDANADGGTDHQGLATVGALGGLSQSLGSTGTLTFVVPGAAQTASATDRLAVKFYVTNSASTSQSFTYAAGGGSGSGINLTGGHAPSTTGIEPWWTYYTGVLPGEGAYMINVANGNLIVKATDVDIHERGIDLAFQRTYNSQSMHDSNNTDGSVPGNYGDGWTTSFDAHLSEAVSICGEKFTAA